MYMYCQTSVTKVLFLLHVERMFNTFYTHCTISCVTYIIREWSCDPPWWWLSLNCSMPNTSKTEWLCWLVTFWSCYRKGSYYRYWRLIQLVSIEHLQWRVAYQQRTLTPPDTGLVLSHSGLACFLILRTISPDLVLFLDFLSFEYHFYYTY